MIHVRDAEESDFSCIVAITNEAIANTTAIWHLNLTTVEARKAWATDRTGRGLPVLVAELDGQVAGFASFGDFRPFDGYLHTVEHSLYVGPAAQGRGVGKALLASLISRAVALRKHAMVAAIEAGNRTSINLHRQAGFKEVGLLPEVGSKFGRWLDLLFMQLLLP